jgi:hypothetical protein
MSGALNFSPGTPSPQRRKTALEELLLCELGVLGEKFSFMPTVARD